jgi:hypothetical protein
MEGLMVNIDDIHGRNDLSTQTDIKLGRHGGEKLNSI